MHVADGRVVFIHYTLTDAQGNMLDQRAASEPMAYLHGAPGIVPGLKAGLQGKSAGDSFDITIPPEDAYGARDPGAFETLPRSQFSDDMPLIPGQPFSADDGVVDLVGTISHVSEDEVTVDLNHPLAGLTLRFKGGVVEVREATEEERASIQI